MKTNMEVLSRLFQSLRAGSDSPLFFTVDKNAVFTAFSPSFRAQMSEFFDLDIRMGLAMGDLSNHPTYLLQFLQPVKETLEGGMGLRRVFAFSRTIGEEILEYHFSPLWEGEALIGVMAWGQENSELHHEAEALRERERHCLERVRALSEELFTAQRALTLYEQTSDLVARLDEDLTLVYLSPSWKANLGWVLEELQGKPISEIIVPADWRLFRESAQEVFSDRSEAKRTLELRLSDSGGRPRWMECRMSHLPEDLRTFSALRVVFRSIDARKAAAGLVSKILLVLGQNPTPVELLDPSGRIVYVNAAFSRVFGWESKDLLGRLTLTLGEDQNRYFAQAKGENLWRGEILAPRQDGSRFPDLVTIYPVRNENGKLTDFAVFHNDMTEERNIQGELERQQKIMLLQARQAQMGELLNMIAHQWRQPLTVISTLIGNLSLKLEAGFSDPEYMRTKLEKMGNTVQFLSETIESFRNFYAPSKNVTSENLFELTKKAIELLGPSLNRNGIKLDYQAPERELLVEVFAGEFLQVLIEIFNNARDAFREVTGKDKIIHLEWATEPDAIVLEVSNNAGVIPEEIVNHIFEPYFTTKDTSGGTGLGLYMAKIIIEDHHGGELNVYCDHEWTSFQIRLKGLPR